MDPYPVGREEDMRLPSMTALPVRRGDDGRRSSGFHPLLGTDAPLRRRCAGRGFDGGPGGTALGPDMRIALALLTRVRFGDALACLDSRYRLY